LIKKQENRRNQVKYHGIGIYYTYFAPFIPLMAFDLSVSLIYTVLCQFGRVKEKKAIVRV
jgi:hypothetical protein